MKIVALIPARMGATRFPAKLIADLCGRPLIARTYLSTVATGVFDEVMVVTDHDDIAEIIRKEGGNVFISQEKHESGSDRIAEAVQGMAADVVVNVQGDEPFQNRQALRDLVAVFEESTISIASLKQKISEEEALNPNAVKVVTDLVGDALYFSRSIIPYNRDSKIDMIYWKHIGVYAYRRTALKEFTLMPKSFLESAEMLEQLRLLENGYKIRMVETSHQAIGIDTKEDLEKARKHFQDS